MNITKPVARNAFAFPDRAALIVDGKPYTYRSLWQRALLLGARLDEAGVRRGDVVAVGLTRCEEIVASVLALARMGAASSPYLVNAKASASEDLLRRNRTRFLVADAGHRLDPMLAPLVTQLDAEALFARAPADKVRVPPMAIDADQLPWWIGLTSGTTGDAKSVARTHAREEMLSAVYPGAEHDYYQRVCVWQSCLTSFGLSAVLRVLQEGTTAILSPKLGYDSFLARLSDDRPTCLIMSTGMAMNIVRDLRASAAAPDAYRGIVSRFVIGGSVAPPQLIDGIKERICDQVEVRYASSESGLLAIVDEDVRTRHPEAHGRLFPWVQADAMGEDGVVLPPGQIGSLRFKTPFTADGYVGDPEATATYFRDGWHWPGDRGSVDAGGYLHLAGRMDTVLNVRGNKMEAQRIESALNSQPGVLESVVVQAVAADGGLPKLIAVVVVQGNVDREALRESCRENVGRNFVPDQIIFASALPKNQSGKVMRDVVVSRLRSREEKPSPAQ